VQRVRDLRDHREADESGQHENCDLGDECHDVLLARSGGSARRFLGAALTISPPRVIARTGDHRALNVRARWRARLQLYARNIEALLG